MNTQDPANDEGDGCIVIPKQVGTWLAVLWIVGGVAAGALVWLAAVGVAALLPGWP